MPNSISDLVEILFRHKGKILVIPLIIAAMTVGILVFWPRTYRSQAQLFLQLGRESVGVDPSASTGPTIGMIQSSREEEVKSASQILVSRGVFGQVVKDLTAEFVLEGGLSDADAAKRENIVTQTIGSVLGVIRSIDPVDDDELAIIELEESFDVKTQRNSTVIELAYDTKSPEAAQKILEKIIDIYRREHLRIHRNPDSNEFLAEQTELLHKQWEEAKEQLTQAKAKYGLISTSGRMAALESQMQSVDLELLNNSRECENAQAQIKSIQESIAKTPERHTASQKSIPNEGADLIREDLYQSQIRYADLKSRMAEGHPLLVNAARQMEDLKNIFEKESNRREETVEDINPLFLELKTMRTKQETFLSGLMAAREKLESQRETLTKQVTEFNESEFKIDRLEQSEALARAKFKEYNEKLEEARVNKAIETDQISSVSVAQTPTLARKPVSPSKLIVIAAGLALCMGLVGLLILVSEKLDDRVRNESELSLITGLPVLNTFQENSSNKRILVS